MKRGGCSMYMDYPCLKKMHVLPKPLSADHLRINSVVSADAILAWGDNELAILSDVPLILMVCATATATATVPLYCTTIMYQCSTSSFSCRQ